jgi:hypothetical protein
VILGSRDRAKAHGLVPGADVRALVLGDGASIAALASALAGEGITLDALVNNAAVSMRGFDAHVAKRRSRSTCSARSGSRRRSRRASPTAARS